MRAPRRVPDRSSGRREHSLLHVHASVLLFRGIMEPGQELDSRTQLSYLKTCAFITLELSEVKNNTQKHLDGNAPENFNNRGGSSLY